MRRPFTLYKEKTKSGTFWYARFWDETSQRYKHSRSTGVLVEGKKERRYEAEEAARKISETLAEIITAQEKPTVAHPTETQPTTAPSRPKYTTVANTPLIEYLSNFWTPNSEYANFKRDVEKNH